MDASCLFSDDGVQVALLVTVGVTIRRYNPCTHTHKYELTLDMRGYSWSDGRGIPLVTTRFILLGSFFLLNLDHDRSAPH